MSGGLRAGIVARRCASEKTSRDSYRRCCSAPVRYPTARAGRWRSSGTVRSQLRYDGRSVSLRTRHGRECAEDFPELAAIAGVLGDRRVTLDGELVCLRPEGHPDFTRLRRRLTGSANNRHPVILQVFDVLHLNGASTRSLPYAERRGLLDLLALDGPAWRTPTSLMVVSAEDFVARVAELGLEGAVAKRRDSQIHTRAPNDGMDQAQGPARRAASRDRRFAGHGPVPSRRSSSHAATPTDPSPVPARSSLGFTAISVERLEARLAELPARRRGTVAWYPAEVSVVASLHGLPDRPVRDAILRQVLETHLTTE